jgi:predicted Fe-Mo cluster-binding NifX family protein
MKFAIPLANGKLTAHFGHCQAFALIEVADNEIARTQILVPPPHEPGILPSWLHELGADVIIAGGMGQRAVGLFDEKGIKVITGALTLPPEELVTSYLNGTLMTGANACDH